MRMTLENYLSLQGNTAIRLAYKLGRSRETIRRWLGDDQLTVIVVMDEKSNLKHVEVGGRVKIVKAVR